MNYKKVIMLLAVAELALISPVSALAADIPTETSQQEVITEVIDSQLSQPELLLDQPETSQQPESSLEQSPPSTPDSPLLEDSPLQEDIPSTEQITQPPEQAKSDTDMTEQSDVISDYDTNVFDIQGGVLISYSGNEAEVVIPDGVLAIGENVFNQNDNITRVILPDSCTRIEDSAFFLTRSLKEVTGGNLSYIGASALEGSAVHSIITDNNCVIGYRAFAGSSISSAVIGDNSSIQDEAFANSSLKTVTLGTGITIGSNAFSYTYITSIDLSDVQGGIDTAFQYCGSLTDVILGKDISSASGTFSNCSQLKSIEVFGATKNISSAFSGCTTLKQAILHDGIENIEGAFRGTAIEDIEIPDSVVSMYQSFKDCTQLRRANIPASVFNTGEAFMGCTSLEDVEISEGVTDLSRTFIDCKSLRRVVLPESITVLQGTFHNSGLEEIDLGNISKIATDWLYTNGGSISVGVFTGTNLEEIILPESIKTIEGGNFGSDSLRKIKILNRGIKLEGITDIQGSIFGTGNVEIIGYRYSQVEYHCNQWGNLTFTAIDPKGESLTYKDAEPEIFNSSTGSQKLYKVTVYDVIHDFKNDEIIKRDIYIPDMGKYCSALAVDGSQFSFSARKDITHATLVSPETVEGIVNGTDIEVTFHYWNKRFGGDGGSGGVYYDYRSNVFCDMYAQSKSGEPLDGIEVYYEGIPENSDYEDGFFDASHAVYDENGDKQSVSGIHRYEWINNTTVSGYAKLRYNKKQEDGTTLQIVPSLFVRGTGTKEYTILDADGVSCEDKNGDSNSYRKIYGWKNSQWESPEDKFTIKDADGNTIGVVHMSFKDTDGYLDSPVLSLDYTVEELADNWGIEVETTATDEFLDNPVTGELMKWVNASLITIKVTDLSEKDDSGGTDPAPPEETPTPPEEKPDVPPEDEIPDEKPDVPPQDEKPDVPNPVPPQEEKPIPPEDGGNGITPTPPPEETPPTPESNDKGNWGNEKLLSDNSGTEKTAPLADTGTQQVLSPKTGDKGFLPEVFSFLISLVVLAVGMFKKSR